MGTEEMIEADFKQISGGSIACDMSTELAISPVGAYHHRQRIPAHDACQMLEYARQDLRDEKSLRYPSVIRIPENAGLLRIRGGAENSEGWHRMSRCFPAKEPPSARTLQPQHSL
jgi:hypothetical protein